MNVFHVLLILLVALPVYWVGFFFFKLNISLKLVKSTAPYSLITENETKKILVLGDSTAVGVGATTAAESLPAKLAQSVGATFVENRAVSGAQVKDLSAQIDGASKDYYDIVLLQIGANDIIRFRSAEKVSSDLEPLLAALKKRSGQIIFITAGNVGGAPIIPPPLRLLYTQANLKYHEEFQILSEKIGVKYVNLYQDPQQDPFIQNPQKHFAKDSFHPSDAGYAIWFETIQSSINK